MSAEMDKATDASGGDEEEWLYGDESEEKAEEEAPNSAKAQPTAEEVHENGVVKQDTGQEDEESDSDSEDDDDVCVTIGDIKTGGSSQPFNAFGSTPVNLNIKAAGRTHASVGPKAKGVDLDALGSVNGIPVLEVDIESFEEKPWRKPGSDLSDYFNYGFNEDTWKTYCEKQRRLRMGYEGMSHASATKIMVHQGRSAHGDRDGALSCFRSDYSSPSNHYNSGSSSRKPSGTIDVIGGQTGTISRVEGRRRHNIEGNNIQVLSEPPSDAEPTPTKMPPFFPPNIPPPPFPPPPHNVSSAPPLIPPPLRRIGTGTGTMGREDMTATTTRDPAERKKRDTERRDTETKRRGDTSPQAVAAGGDMRVRRGTVIEDTNTRRSRGAERTRSPARNSLLTRRTNQSPQSDSLSLSLVNRGTRCDPQAFCLTYQTLDCSSNIFQFTLKVKNPKHCFMYTLYTTCIF
ncbi:pre-mRNA 3'-end-processing factor FIP1 isoform X3 [Oncorhynchus mykiss]|uniref:pre-mRNA 3'-end-processing factor FIP1 isoform X3 n=1 Tax=Oncorhynchus mykiss TaxID=8022 RepID=UPI001877B9A1|nr:pre-mRNA 3'-end-processing factor FIP1 isoform X3 [Oncorhynchus mykiss]